VRRVVALPAQWRILKHYGTLIALLAILAGFSLLSPRVFPTPANVINITRQISLLTIIAIGATLVMTVGEFDLSIGSMASFGGVLATGLVVRHVPIALSLLVSLGIAFLFGLFNGCLVTRFRIFSFITTLSTGTILSGFTFWYTGGATIFGGIPDDFLWFGQGIIGSVPVPTVLMFLVVGLFWFILTYTEFGRRLYAIGGNPLAAQLSGVNVARDKTFAFGYTALLAAATGIILASRLGSAHPTAGGSLFLPSYAAVFLGMTTVKGGYPNAWGTFVGSLMIGVIANGLTILNVPFYLQDIVTGMIVVLAVIVQSLGEGRG